MNAEDLSPKSAADASGKTVVVIGDSLWDIDYCGDTERISPESPVPVVRQTHSVEEPGGAARAAVEVARLGLDVILVTRFSLAGKGLRLQERLAHENVEVKNLDERVDLPIKTRVRSANTTLVMLDDSPHAAPAPASAAIQVSDLLSSADLVIASDYGMGLLNTDWLRSMLTDCASHARVIWDPHSKGSTPVPGCLAATPNSREADHLAGVMSVQPTANLEEDAETLRAHLGSTHLLITNAAGGCTLASSEDPPCQIPVPKRIGDFRGAGDRVVARIAYGLAHGEDFRRAARNAMEFASTGFDRGQPTKLLNERTIRDVQTARMRCKRGIVVASGCFDVLHLGHMDLITFAAGLGDRLVLAINSDASVRRNKGSHRPIINETDRVRQLLSIHGVDNVYVFAEPTPLAALRLLEPDVYVKGDEYLSREMPERALLDRMHCQIRFCSHSSPYSTSRLVGDKDLR